MQMNAKSTHKQNQSQSQNKDQSQQPAVGEGHSTYAEEEDFMTPGRVSTTAVWLLLAIIVHKLHIYESVRELVYLFVWAANVLVFCV